MHKIYIHTYIDADVCMQAAYHLTSLSNSCSMHAFVCNVAMITGLSLLFEIAFKGIFFDFSFELSIFAIDHVPIHFSTIANLGLLIANVLS